MPVRIGELNLMDNIIDLLMHYLGAALQYRTHLGNISLGPVFLSLIFGIIVAGISTIFGIARFSVEVGLCAGALFGAAAFTFAFFWLWEEDSRQPGQGN